MSCGGCREGVGISLERTDAGPSWKWGGGWGAAFGFPSVTMKMASALVTHHKRPFHGLKTLVLNAEWGVIGELQTGRQRMKTKRETKIDFQSLFEERKFSAESEQVKCHTGYRFASKQP